MEKIHFMLSFFVLVLAGSLAALSCGSSRGQSQLQAMSLNPAAADAKNYPGGQVQFTATGYYINPTHTVTPQSAIWAACQNGSPTNDVSVTSSGVAQCGANASGDYSIDAWYWGFSHVTCDAIAVCGGRCSQVTASAQLTCP